MDIHARGGVVSRLSTDQSECISQLQMDRYFGGELSDAQRNDFEHHVQQCQHCAELHAALGRDRAAFLGRVPRWESLRAARTPVRSKLRWGGGAALAIAAAAALMLVPREAGVRLKGRPSINLYVKREGQVARATSGDTFASGDLLRVTYSSQHPVYLALLQRDRDGVVVQYPADAEKAALVQAGRDVALDFSIQLDAQPGEEQLIALFCDRATELGPVRASLEHMRPIPVVMHCQIDELVLNKRTSAP
jgi:hypothetical protein